MQRHFEAARRRLTVQNVNTTVRARLRASRGEEEHDRLGQLEGPRAEPADDSVRELIDSDMA